MQDLIFIHENLARHQVTPDEVEDCFLDGKRKVFRSRDGSYIICGRTLAGRILEIGFRKLPDGRILIFHAMNATKQYRKRYEG